MHNLFITGKFNHFPVFLFLTVLLFLSLIPTDLNAAVPHEEEIQKGLDHCYHFRWNKAEQVFQSLVSKYPEDPEGYHYLSSIYFWYYLSNKKENDFNNFRKYSDQAIDKAGDKLDINKNNPSVLYLIGSSYNYRTVAFAKAENYLDAVWAAKKSESYLADCLSADPGFYDAYLGLGLYNFAVANIPSGFKWALSLAGINGSENKGLKYIRIAAEKGKFAKAEANYYLAQILSDALMDPYSASPYLEMLSEKYPENLLFSYTFGVIDIKKRELNHAERRLVNIIKAKNSQFSQIISFSNFLMGDICFRRNIFEEAKKYYHVFLNSAVDKDYTGIASYRLALCYDLTGDRKNAVKYYSRAEKGNMDIDDDIYAKRKGNIYSKRNLSETEIEILKAGNLLEAGEFGIARDTLYSLLKTAKTGKLKAEIHLLLSEALFFLNEHGESLNNALQAAGINSSDEEWIPPFAWYNAARAAQKMGKHNEAKKYIEEAKDYSGYDYRKKLSSLVKNIEKNY
jgi:tetratricopeptide (TPR) repeat protein